jgi:hypothetical protein
VKSSLKRQLPRDGLARSRDSSGASGFAPRHCRYRGLDRRCHAVGRISWRHPNLPQPFYGSGSSAMTIIRNAKFRILPPQPASPVSAPQNRALPRHFANTARSPCRELGYRSAIPAPGLRGRFLVSRFCWTAGPGTGFHYLPRRACGVGEETLVAARREEVSHHRRDPQSPRSFGRGLSLH